MLQGLNEFSGSIITDPSVLKEYSSDFSFIPPVLPALVVRPKNREEIVETVRWAARTKTPLVPLSSGPPRFRGDTIPSRGGSVVVDLSGMKKIVKVTRKNRVALIEPGVTFGELIDALKKEGLRPNMPFLPRSTKSVVASLLEREPVLMPKYHWDISDPLACVEIVFGNGEVFRTGEAAGPGDLEEQWAAGNFQKAPYGPGPMHWHRLIQGAQGTMGIVTWASLRCELLPNLEEPFFVPSRELSKLLELSHWLVRMRLVNECFIVNATILATCASRRWPDDYETLIFDLPPFVLFFNLAAYEYFPEERIDSYLKGVREILKNIGLEAKKALCGISAMDFLKMIQRPSPDPYWKLRMKGACHDIFFITITQKVEKQVFVMYEVLRSFNYPSTELGIYIQPIVQGVNLHCEFNLFYDPNNKKEVEKMKSLSWEAVKVLLEKGAFFSRPYDHTARIIMNRDAAHVAALRKIKAIFDPEGIMNPGKLCF
uniref:D-lactate dehydrogenase (cytochrome) n=1 Tax=candidate division WOR-3 bacterium TaxID=2052148 RepID=A0A7C2K1T0_UNCW3